MTAELPGALALVTGAGSGIGRATSLALSMRGARVLCADIDLDGAGLTAKACRAAGGRAEPLLLDVANRDAVGAAAAEVHEEHGALDVLVNNAGVGMSGRFLDTELSDWDWIVGINLLGAVHCAKAFGPPMVARRRGHVVNVSSGLAFFPRSTEPAYIATKAGLLGLSRSLRTDWAPYGVGVSAVCPGIVNTPIIATTRFRGETAEPRAVAQAERLFATRGRPPERVAAAIVRAVERNRAVVPVGVEAWLGWIGQRLLPTGAMDRLAAGSQRITRAAE